MSTQESQPEPTITVTTLRKMKKAGDKIACLTAYDASFAHTLDAAGIDVILVGDSLGMVIQGEDTTVPVTMDHMVYHSRSVARARQRALLMVDMPFMTFATPEQALRNAATLMQQGLGHMVKLEGGAEQVETVRRLSDNGIPVCAHLGLQPQSVHKVGGYKVQGRDERAAQRMLDDARKLEGAGAEIVLLECVPSPLAKAITAALEVPVIGIGAGADCDGQILVLYDMLGITPGRRPRFAKDFLEEKGSIGKAIEAYVESVKTGTFPGPEHGFR